MECEEDHSIKYIKYGNNLIDVPVRGILEIFMNEILNPFYIFQILAMLLWFAEGLFSYPLILLLVSAVSMIVSIYEMRTNLSRIR